jgi:hypothetical protein
MRTLYQIFYSPQGEEFSARLGLYETKEQAQAVVDALTPLVAIGERETYPEGEAPELPYPPEFDIVPEAYWAESDVTDDPLALMGLLTTENAGFAAQEVHDAYMNWLERTAVNGPQE